MSEPSPRPPEAPRGRPRITLAWAQSLDGSIAAAPGLRSSLSGQESLAMTHALRAAHRGLLVGIGTVLADDPSLTLRHAEGRQPRPVVLDSELRLSPRARLLAGGKRGVLVLARPGADRERRLALERAGARVIEVPVAVGGRLSLPACLEALALEEIDSLMVEGGAAVLLSFLAARLVDEVNVTLAPLFLGGLNPFALPSSGIRLAALPFRLAEPGYEVLGRDLVVRGRPEWEGPRETSGGATRTRIS